MANIIEDLAKIGMLNGLRTTMYEGQNDALVLLRKPNGTTASFTFNGQVVPIEFNAATTSDVSLTLDGNPQFDINSVPVTVDRIVIYNVETYLQIMLDNSVEFTEAGRFTLNSCTITI